MKAAINNDLCNGCGDCAKTCSAVFLLNVDGKAVVKVHSVLPDIQSLCMEAMEKCPTKAIQITGGKWRKL